MKHLKKFENFGETEEAYNYAKQKVDELKSSIEKEFDAKVIYDNNDGIDWRINDIVFSSSYVYDEEDGEYGDNFYTFGWEDIRTGNDGQWDTDSIDEIIQKIKECIDKNGLKFSKISKDLFKNR